jgi:hypothetical protein
MVANFRHILSQSSRAFHQIQMARENVQIIWVSTSPNTSCIIPTNGKVDPERSNYLSYPMPPNGNTRTRTGL